MMWLWKKYRREVDEANRRAERAEQLDAEASTRLAAAKRQAVQSRNITAALRREVAINHFTQMLQEAMGGR